ncbi:MAG TPA: DUF4019 domain-containing protein [Xanthomonadales bacterium]|nr:DUF4019 domain-containing protein [Xanthomonadales bacterium]
MRKISLMVVFLMLFASFSASADTEEEGSEAAEQWLVLVDAHQYAESWDEAASLFQGNVPKEDWVLALENVHTPLGGVESRSLESTEFTSTLPGVPDGEYVVIKFSTSFAEKAGATETVTVMKTDDGNWRAAGYFIQ